jgi:hypothetical protein
MKHRAEVMVIGLLLAGALPGWAVGDESPWVYDIGMRLLGADVGVGYRGLALLPNLETTFWVRGGAGYEWLTYYREPSGALVAPGGLDGRDPSYVRIEGTWSAGIEQGFAWNESTRRNLVEAFAFYRGRIDMHRTVPGELLDDSPGQDKAGGMVNSLLAGFAYDDLSVDTRSRRISGLAAEISAEGNQEFVRFNGTIQGFLPALDVSGPGDLLSISLGEFLSIDCALGLNGGPVPLPVRQTLGGRHGRIGLGYSVRGVDPGSLDTNVKAVSNLEARATLHHFPDLVPGLVAFWDLGYYDQAGEAGVPVSASGWVSSVGIGVSMDFFHFATVVVYVDYRLDAENAGGGRVSLPAIEFGFHF